MTDLLLRIFDARQRQSEREEESLIQLLMNVMSIKG